MLIPRGPSDARILIATECVTYRDLQTKTILSDREFERIMEAAGVDRNRCFITSLIREAVPGQKFEFMVPLTKKAVTSEHVPLHNRMVKPELLRYVEALERDIDLVRPGVVLALGNGALFALTGKWGIRNWRSSLIEYTSPKGHKCLVIPTYDPGFVQAVWKERNTVIFDVRKAWGISVNGPPPKPEYDFEIEPDFGTVARRLAALQRRVEQAPTRISVDVETRKPQIACIGLAWSKTEAICIPLMRAVHAEIPNWEQRIHYWRPEEETYLCFRLYKLLTHPNCHVIGQNFLYDAQYFYRWLLFIPNVKRDTMLSQHIMFSNMPKGLDVLSSLHCEYHVYWKDESKDWDPKLGERQLWIYNCIDAVRTFEVDENQQRAIDAFAQTWPEIRAVHDFQQELFYPVLVTMINGLRVNNDSKARLSEELKEAIGSRNAWLTDVLGEALAKDKDGNTIPLNVRSSIQMKDLLYRVLQQKEIISRQTHSVSCDDAALEKISLREPLLEPICRVIRELRSLNVFRSTFLEAPVDTDERMRCSFNIGGTETFRFSSSENAFGSGMNLQNIPEGDEGEGLPNIRALFLADPDYEFFDIDLDSADLRVVTWDSDCAGMKRYFAEGKKPYVEIAKEYFQDPSIDKTHDAYKAFKVICHATNYDGGASEIFARLPKSAKVGGLSVGGIEAIQQWYFERFPEIRAWQGKVRSDLLQRGFVQNVFGYRIYYFDRLDDRTVKGAIAAIPQSTVGCLINRGYMNIHRNEPNIQILLQVHDSLAGQYPLSMRSTAQKKIIDHCTIPLQYASGTLVIPVGIKASTVSWGDCA